MPSSKAPLVQSVSAIALTVSNGDRASQFFTQALGFKIISDAVTEGEATAYLLGLTDGDSRSLKVRWITLSLGDETIRLMEFPNQSGQPIPDDAQANDLWFQHFAIIVSDIDQAYAHLQSFDFEPVSPEPQTLPVEQGEQGIRAYKFRGPDRHNLELLWFPSGMGRDKWHQLAQANPDSPFLGIDHSAISISDSDQSLDFYRNLLGLSLEAQQLNKGKTQEVMDGLFGAEAVVTSTGTGSAPGVEFLDYLTPAGGRPRPLGLKSCDLAHLHYEMQVEDMEGAIASLERAKVQFVSPTVVDISDLPLPGKLACLLQDPDGHGVMLVEA